MMIKAREEKLGGMLIGEQNNVVVSFGNLGLGGVHEQTTTSLLVNHISLISNIGGGLGLALGISVYSIIEFILNWAPAWIMYWSKRA